MKKISLGKYSSKTKSTLSDKDKVDASISPKRSHLKKKSRKKITGFKIISLLILIIIISITSLFYYRVNVLSQRQDNTSTSVPNVTPVNECKNIMDPKCWTKAFRPELKQTNGYTNVLILGIDTRSTDTSLKNTDSIIFASFNHETQKTMMVSIPRDMYINDYRTKINAIYAFTSKKNPDDEYFYIKEAVSKIFDKPIHYSATIRFDAVTGLIDSFGGVEICIDKAFTAQYPVEKPKPGESHWKYIDFPEGCQLLNGEKALVYARFRYLRRGPAHLGSDFSRGRRQQEVIDALKNKALEQEMSITRRAEVGWNLLQTYKDNISHNLKSEDVLAGLFYLDSADRDPLRAVLDPMFGGTLDRIIYSDGMSYIKFRDNTYKQVQKELQDIWDNPDFYRDTPRILVSDQSDIESHPAVEIMNQLKSQSKFYRSFDFEVKEINNSLFGIHIVDFSNGEKTATLKMLSQKLGISEDNIIIPDEINGYTKSKKNEDFLIIIAPPYIFGPVQQTPQDLSI
jgi:LCP family protein required for cell wall assembly